MELELKHLAPYLPYRLKWSLQEMTVFVMTGITSSTLYTDRGTVLTWPKNPDLPIALFPLLRPLSDLTKPINIDGNCFHPILFLAELAIQNENVKPEIKNSVSFGFDYKIVQKPFGKILKVTRLDEWILIISFNEPERCKHYIFEKLIEWHFDVFGLIDQGLALPLI